jgi:NTP pyrophosphatase (non-canonical NTP hydrolase)
LNFNEYQAKAMSTAVYPASLGLVYVGLKLAGEAGEVADKLGKSFRDGSLTIDTNGRMTQPSSELTDALEKELGDVLWYVAAAAHELGIPLSVIAGRNIAKLASRSLRGVLLGDGDDR